MQHYNTIIVGSGAAGAILAARLSEDETRSVLLLEAGPDYPDLATMPDDLKYGFGTTAGILTTSHDWGYQATATPYAREMPVPRGRVIGGSSAVNAQIFLRGVPEDFAAWAAQGNDRWSFEAVLPAYCRLETDLDFQNDYHGSDGPISVQRYAPADWKPDQQAFYQACRKAGFPDCPDHNQPGTTGTGPYPLNTHNRIRQSTALKYLLPARSRPNLTIRCEAQVLRILFHVKRATGVLVHFPHGTEEISGDEIILCAGAIGSPALLLHSGIGPADDLRALEIPVLADLPGVGKNLRDHPAANMVWALRDDFVIDEQKHWHQVGLRYTASGSPLVNDMIVYIGTIPANHTLLLRPTVNLQLSQGTLRLRTADPTVTPELDYCYLSAPFDRQRLREGVEYCLALVESGEFAGIIGERLAPTPEDLASRAALDNWLLRAVNTGHHTCGTCKMGPATDPLAVVDQSGQVYGVSGLRVADAAIMPDCVRANTNATTMMMAEHIAAMIRAGD